MIWYILTSYLSIGATLSVQFIKEETRPGEHKIALVIATIAMTTFWLPGAAIICAMDGIKEHLKRRANAKRLEKLRVMKSGKQCWMPSLILGERGVKHIDEVICEEGWFTVSAFAISTLSYWESGGKTWTYNDRGSLA